MTAIAQPVVISNLNKGAEQVGEYLTISEAAERLQVSEATMYRWLNSKKRKYFPSARKKNRWLKTSPWIIPIEDIEAFERGEVDMTDDLD